MACNSCAKPFSLFRKEKGCPACGFSYCSKCLDNKIFVMKLNTEAKVCSKCSRAASNPNQTPSVVVPPDAYYKRLRIADSKTSMNVTTEDKPDAKDQHIMERLKKLKEDRNAPPPATTDEDIRKRLQNIRGEVPSTSDAEIRSRLARLIGVPVENLTSKPVLPPPDTRTEQEQVDDLLKQYQDVTNIDSKYKNEFDRLVSDMESRIKKLKENISSGVNLQISAKSSTFSEDEVIAKILQKQVLPAPGTRTEQEQVEDLLKQYLEVTHIDSKYKNEFDGLISDMQSRIKNLKQDVASGENVQVSANSSIFSEDEVIRNILQKMKTEASLDDNNIGGPSTSDELPFCEICNEDATMRCLGCKYLFCKRCFMEHKDDDDGCNEFEAYHPPKNIQS